MNRKINLLAEAVAKLKEHGKTASDILWCGCEAIGWFTWDDFSVLAGRTDYEQSFGGNEIPNDLLVVGKDFWLGRDDYDGLTWWEFYSYPKKPEKYYKPKGLKLLELFDELGIKLD